MVLKIYGVPGSQPVRAVMWVLEMKKLEYELVKAVPGTPADKKYSSQHPAYQKLSKGRGQIPMMDDDGLVIGESHAILTYLCQKHGWTDLYPADLRGTLHFLSHICLTIFFFFNLFEHLILIFVTHIIRFQ